MRDVGSTENMLRKGKRGEALSPGWVGKWTRIIDVTREEISMKRDYLSQCFDQSIIVCQGSMVLLWSRH